MASYDIAIVGAGMVGSSLALALSNLPLKICVLEALPLQDAHTVPSGLPRTQGDSPLSLNLSSYQLLQAIGIWKTLVHEAQPILQVHVSEKGRWGKLRFLAAEMATPALGYVVSRKQLTAALQQRLIQIAEKKQTAKAHMAFYRSIRLTELTSIKQGWQLSWETNKDQSALSQGGNSAKHIEATWVIAADGYHSQVRQLLNIVVHTHSLSDAALAAWVTISAAHHQVAYERFDGQDIVALLPGIANEMGLVWTASPERIAALNKLSDQDLLACLQSVIGYRLGRFLALSPRASHLIKPFSTSPVTIPGTLLLGNAAYSLHPVAAQGFNCSLQDVVVLVDVITQILDTQSPSCNHKLLGEADKLSRYGSDRYVVHGRMQRLTHSIPHLFQIPGWPFSLARSSGLSILNGFPIVKKRLARYFMDSGAIEYFTDAS